MICFACKGEKLRVSGRLAGFSLLRCLGCGSERRGDPLEALTCDPLSFDPDDTGRGVFQPQIESLERREALLLEALRRIRLELPKIQTQLRELFSKEVA